VFLRERWEVIEQLERDRDALLEYYAKMVPKALVQLTGEERHKIYRMLRLEVYKFPNGDIEKRGLLGEGVLYLQANDSRRPHRYGQLTALEIEELFVRVGAGGEAYDRARR
jgi:hypothetical protein